MDSTPEKNLIKKTRPEPTFKKNRIQISQKKTLSGAGYGSDPKLNPDIRIQIRDKTRIGTDLIEISIFSDKNVSATQLFSRQGLSANRKYYSFPHSWFLHEMVYSC